MQLVQCKKKLQLSQVSENTINFQKKLNIRKKPTPHLNHYLFHISTEMYLKNMHKITCKFYIIRFI